MSTNDKVLASAKEALARYKPADKPEGSLNDLKESIDSNPKQPGNNVDSKEQLRCALEIAGSLPLSVCIMWCDKDREYLDGCIKSLPIGCEIILVRTKPGTSTSFEFAKEELANGHIHKQYVYLYKDWSFSEARNLMHQAATRDMVLYLDADERLANAEEFGWAEFLELALSDKRKTVGGYNINIFSYNHQMNNGLGGGTYHPIPRLIKNNPEFKWVYRCHEQIKNSLTENNYVVLNTEILVNHYGYLSKEPQDNIDTLTRNIDLLMKDLTGEHKNNVYLLSRLRGHLNGLNILKVIN